MLAGWFCFAAALLLPGVGVGRWSAGHNALLPLLLAALACVAASCLLRLHAWRPHACCTRICCGAAAVHGPPLLSVPRCNVTNRAAPLQVGDGTTSVVVLAGELLREAEQLVNQKIHPMVIIAGVHCTEPRQWLVWLLNGSRCHGGCSCAGAAFRVLAPAFRVLALLDMLPVTEAPCPPAPCPGFREAAEAARQRLVAIAADNKADPEVRISLRLCVGEVECGCLNRWRLQQTPGAAPEVRTRSVSAGMIPGYLSSRLCLSGAQQFAAGRQSWTRLLLARARCPAVDTRLLHPALPPRPSAATSSTSPRPR